MFATKHVNVREIVRNEVGSCMVHTIFSALESLELEAITLG